MNWTARMTQIGQAREECGINDCVWTVENGAEDQKVVGMCLGKGEENSLKSMVGFKSFSRLACMLRRAHNLLPNQHLLFYFFALLSILSQECWEWGASYWKKLTTGHINNITSIVAQRAADCSRRSSVSNCHCRQCVWSTLGLCSFQGDSPTLGGDGRGADGWEISITACRYLRSERAHGSRYDNKQSSICLTLLKSARWIGEAPDGLDGPAAVSPKV